MKRAEGTMDRNNCSNGRLKSKSTWFMSSMPPAIAEEDMVAHMCCWRMRLSKNQCQSAVWDIKEHHIDAVYAEST
jgi:hypothetical protein